MEPTLFSTLGKFTFQTLVRCKCDGRTQFLCRQCRARGNHYIIVVHNIFLLCCAIPQQVDITTEQNTELLEEQNALLVELENEIAKACQEENYDRAGIKITHLIASRNHNSVFVQLN